MFYKSAIIFRFSKKEKPVFEKRNEDSKRAPAFWCVVYLI